MVDPFGLDWFKPINHPYSVGRDGTPIEDGKGTVGGWIDENIPAGHTAGVFHDDMVGFLTAQGIPDWVVNIPTMPVAYVFSVGYETGVSVSGAFDKNTNHSKNYCK
jgi:hypothetical protein